MVHGSVPCMPHPLRNSGESQVKKEATKLKTSWEMKRYVNLVLGPELMFAKRDKHYPSRSGQTSLATAVINFTKPVTKINSGPSKSHRHSSFLLEGFHFNKMPGNKPCSIP